MLRVLESFYYAYQVKDRNITSSTMRNKKNKFKYIYIYIYLILGTADKKLFQWFVINKYNTKKCSKYYL